MTNSTIMCTEYAHTRTGEAETSGTFSIVPNILHAWKASAEALNPKQAVELYAHDAGMKPTLYERRIKGVTHVCHYFSKHFFYGKEEMSCHFNKVVKRRHVKNAYDVHYTFSGKDVEGKEFEIEAKALFILTPDHSRIAKHSSFRLDNRKK